MDTPIPNNAEQPKRSYAVISTNSLNDKSCMTWNGGTYQDSYHAMMQIRRNFEARGIPASITEGGLGVSLLESELPTAMTILAEFDLTVRHLDFGGVTFIQGFKREVAAQKAIFGSADITNEGVDEIRSKLEGATRRINPMSN